MARFLTAVSTVHDVIAHLVMFFVVAAATLVLIYLWPNDANMSCLDGRHDMDCLIWSRYPW